MRRATITVVLAVLALGALGVATAYATETEFMNHEELASGMNKFSSKYSALFDTRGHSSGHASACLGISGHPEFEVCGGEGAETQSLFWGLEGTGFLHNHSTFTSFFYAWANHT